MELDRRKKKTQVFSLWLFGFSCALVTVVSAFFGLYSGTEEKNLSCL